MLDDEELTRALPFRHISPDRTRWFLKDDADRAVADSATEHFSLGRDELRARGLYVKGVTRRVGFYFVTDGGAKIFCKGTVYRHWRESLRHKTRGWSEARNLLLAAKRRIPVPAVYGFGLRRSWGLVDRSLVLMEYLGDHRTLLDLLETSASQDQRRAYLARSIPLIVSLYRGCANHIDLGGPNIMIHSSSAERDVLIDFQDVPFHPAPSAEILCYHLGFLLHNVGAHFSEEDIQSWTRRVLQTAGVPAGDALLAKIAAYRRSPPERKQSMLLR